jgi:hypothetical protein
MQRSQKRNVKAYNASGFYLGYHVTRLQALRLIARGKAHAITSQKPFEGIILGDQHASLHSRAESHAYELCGIEKYPQIVQGGLVRTETKPSPPLVYHPQTKDQRSATPPEQKEPLPEGFQL